MKSSKNTLKGDGGDYGSAVKGTWHVSLVTCAGSLETMEKRKERKLSSKLSSACHAIVSPTPTHILFSLVERFVKRGFSEVLRCERSSR